MAASKYWAGDRPTKEELARLDDDDAVDDLFAYALEQLQGPESNVPKDLWILDAAWRFNAEVENGGFLQYFWNQGAEHAGWAVDALGRIEDGERQALLQKAIGLWTEQETRVAAAKQKKSLQAFSDLAMDGSFRELDRAYYQVGYPLESKLVAFIRNHPHGFASA